MALPKLNTPTIAVQVPSTEETLNMRPFRVGEEKVLLLALHSEDSKTMTNSVKQIISQCTISPENFKVDNLTTFDVEWLFLKLRADSIGETITVRFKGLTEEETECEECRKPKEMSVNLEDAKISKNEKHSKIIDLGDDIKIHMKYPSIDFLEHVTMAQDTEQLEVLFGIFWKCVDCITQGEDATFAKDVPEKEGIKWLEQLSNTQFKKLEEFFETMPSVVLDVPVKCKSCGFEETYTLKGLSDFFA